MDEDGYPTEDLVNQIKNYDVVGSGSLGLMELVYENWTYDYPYREYYKSGKEYIYRLSTGGWSGNESLIYYLQSNQLWWALNWFSSRRGGHYEFRIKEK